MINAATQFALRNIPRPVLQRVAPLILPVIGLKNRGNDVECPICSKTYSKFMPYGRLHMHRENALCPHCLSLERHRLMWLYLHQQTAFFTEELKVMHIAPEACFIERFKALANLDYQTGDLESPLTDHHFDVHEIPFEDESFDVLICNHVLEHVEDDHRVMTEIHRVLKPGGWAILQIPQDVSREQTYEDPSITDPAEREKHFWQDDHLRLYGRDYGQRLEKAGFKVSESVYAQELPKEQSLRYALTQDEIFYFCEK